MQLYNFFPDADLWVTHTIQHRPKINISLFIILFFKDYLVFLLFIIAKRLHHVKIIRGNIRI